MTLIVFLLILIILILVHELGHFWVAKKSGIRVDEFGLGFPPRIKAFKKGETEYSVNAIPFGGFVKIHGENPQEEEKKDPDLRSFVAQPKIVQAAVLIAGVAFNVLLGWLLLSFGLTIGLPISQSTDLAQKYPAPETHVTLLETRSDSPAEMAGLSAGDQILFLGLDDEHRSINEIAEFQEIIAGAEGQTLEVIYRRGDEVRSTLVEPVAGVTNEDGVGIGVYLDKVGYVQLPVLAAFGHGLMLTGQLLQQIVIALGQIATDAVTGEGMQESVVGPVGIFSMVGDAQEMGFVHLLVFTAMISFNLAIINLIPFPALDGGRLLFLGIEAITNRHIPATVANYLNLLGFVILVSVLMLVTYKDIINLLG